jgi:hypothetical protein
VVSGDCQRCAGVDHVSDETDDTRRVRAAIHVVAEKHNAALSAGTPPSGRGASISDLREECFEQFALTMRVWNKIVHSVPMFGFTDIKNQL